MQDKSAIRMGALLVALGGAAYMLIARAKPSADLPGPSTPPTPQPPQPAKPTAGFFATPLQKFVAQAWDGATKIALEQNWPMPQGRDFVLSQSAWESGKNGVPGVSYLTTKYNNLFGIKAGAGWSGDKTPPLWTWEEIGGKSVKVQAYFRAYPSWEASMRDWVNFLQQSRYTEVRRALAAGNVQGAFVALKEGGYATDSTYPDKLAGVYAQVRSVVV